MSLFVDDAWRLSYRGRRILVTGHTGFKGAWMSAWLKSLGAEIAGFALAPVDSQRILFDAIDPESTFAMSVFADIDDLAAVGSIVADFAPEIIFHLAAQPLVRASYLDPLGTFRTNTMGTVHLLEAARHQPSVRAVVNVTSDKCYENREQIWPYRETDSMGGHDPYSASKGASEIVTQSYARAFFEGEMRSCVTVRAGNVIGGGDFSADRLIPDLVRAIEDGRPLEVRNPGSVRPWQHVLEPVSGYLCLGAGLLSGKVGRSGGWNFGPRPEDSISVAELMDVARRHVGERWPGIHTGPSTGPHEGNLLSLDIAKARLGLGWFPVLTVAERLRLTMEWYMACMGGNVDLGEVTARQISDFETSISATDQCGYRVRDV